MSRPNPQGKGNTQTARTRPKYGTPWRECPITGLNFPEPLGILVRGRLVHPLAADRPTPEDEQNGGFPGPFGAYLNARGLKPPGG